MQYREIVTHQDSLAYLKEAIDKDTLSHANILWGAPGTGKLAAALAVSQYLLCNDRREDGPCGVCSSCAKTAQFIHPDILFVFPIASVRDTCKDWYPQWREALHSNLHLSINEWLQIVASGQSTKNPTGNIYSRDVKHIIETLSLKSFESDAKVLIIWMAEYLGKEGNKLLKIIEEPPENTYIFLIVEERNAVLPTILSRCQQIYFPPFTEEFIARELEKRSGVDSKTARAVASASTGNWNNAKAMVNRSVVQPIARVQDWLRAIWGSDMAALTIWVNDMGGESRREQMVFVEYMLAIFQRLFWHKWGIDFYALDEEIKLIKWLDQKIEFDELEELVELFEYNLRAINRNANGKILWMDTSLGFATALRQSHAPLRSTG